VNVVDLFSGVLANELLPDQEYREAYKNGE